MTRKRSRASKSNEDLHTQVVTTDVSRFSKIVQQLTGMPNPKNSLQLVLKPLPKKPNVEGLSGSPPEKVIFPIITCLQRPEPSLPVKPSFMAAEDDFHHNTAASLPFSLPKCFTREEDDIFSSDSEELHSFAVGKDSDIFNLDSEELWKVMELNTRENFMLSNGMTKVRAHGS